MAAASTGSPSVLSAMLGNGRLSPEIAVIPAAAYHRLELLLFDSLLEHDGVPTRTRAVAAEALERAAEANTRLVNELHRILGLLAESGIPALPLKGPVLAQLLWDDLHLRRCRDLDILVAQRNVPAAVRILEAAGYRLPPPPGGLLRQLEFSHQEEGVTLDLHWNITHAEMAFPLDFDELWAESREFCCNGMTIPVMSPEWLFIATSVYLAKSYPWPELIHLSDLARLTLRFPAIDWDRVAAIALRTGTHRLCAVGLALIDALPGSAVSAAAHRLFPAETTVRGMARRLRRAAERDQALDAALDDNSDTTRRLRRLLTHPAFRERAVDKAWAYLSLVPLLFMPGRSSAGQGWTQASLTRLGRLAGSAATRLSATLSSVSWMTFSDTSPAPGTRFYPLDEAGVLLSEARKCLFALSPSAAFVWCALQEGLPPRTVARQLAARSGQTFAEARAQVVAATRGWRALGLLGGSPSPAAPVPIIQQRESIPPRSTGAPRIRATATARSPLQRRYQLLGTAYEVGFPSVGLARAMDSALGHLSTAKAPDVTVSVAGVAAAFLIIVDRRAVDRCVGVDAVVPTLKSALSADAINREDFGLYLHAAMLRDSEGAILLPAPSQSGKTCLAAALAREGFIYCTDETTLLDAHTFAASGLPTALAVKAAGWDLLQPLYPELRALSAHKRADGKIVKYLPPPHQTPAADRDAPCRVHSIVFPHYAKQGVNELTPVPRVDALRLLLDECVAMRLQLAPAPVQDLVAWLETVRCYSLTYRDLPGAVELLLGCSSSLAEHASAGCPAKARA